MKNYKEAKKTFRYSQYDNVIANLKKIVHKYVDQGLTGVTTKFK